MPTADLARLKADPKFNITSKISHRVIYFNFDHLDRVSPFIFAKDGKPLAKNPLLDIRVRRAISKAINRPAIAERVMEGPGDSLGPAGVGQAVRQRAGARRPTRTTRRARRSCSPKPVIPTASISPIHGPSGTLRQRREDRAGRGADAGARRHRGQGRDRADGTVRFAARRSRNSASTWSAGARRPAKQSSPLRSLLATYNTRQGPGRRELGPLQQSQGRLPDRAGAAAGRRRELAGSCCSGRRSSRCRTWASCRSTSSSRCGRRQGRDRTCRAPTSTRWRSSSSRSASRRASRRRMTSSFGNRELKTRTDP